jgi:hypothetical protein
MSNQTDTSVTPTDDVLPSSVWFGRLLLHMRKPENLVTYLVFTAWMKFMGIAEHVPTVTIG